MKIATVPPGQPPIAAWRTQEGIVPIAAWLFYVLQGESPILYVPSPPVIPSEDPSDA